MGLAAAEHDQQRLSNAQLDRRACANLRFCLVLARVAHFNSGPAGSSKISIRTTRKRHMQRTNRHAGRDMCFSMAFAGLRHLW